MSEYIEIVAELKGWRVKLYHDDDAFHLDPRKDRDNLGRLICCHRRYKLGDVHGFTVDTEGSDGWAELRDLIEDEEPVAVITPVFMYDHSGLAFRLGGGFSDVDSAGWDWGQVGWCYVTEAAARDEYGPSWRDRLSELMALLKSELDEYGAWCSGEVYGYRVFDPQGEEQDACWGYIGYQWAQTAARDALTQAVESFEEREAEVACLMQRGFPL